ncbi:uncharacterized protein [Watersipora subatra]|uniref:uncharacterized protein n=1 Tax=Watersipora subatra TaxID=2589382 RepID=UPI00355C8BC5
MGLSLAASVSLILAVGQINAQFGGISLGGFSGSGFGGGRGGLSNLVGQLAGGGTQFGINQFGNPLGGNQIGNQLGGNQFGNQLAGNPLGNQFGGNPLGNQFGGNQFDENQIDESQFGGQPSANQFGNQFENQFGRNNGMNGGPVSTSRSFSDNSGPVFTSNSFSSSTGDFGNGNNFDTPNFLNNQNSLGTQGGFGNQNGGFGIQNGLGTQGGLPNNFGRNDALSNSGGFTGGIFNGPASIGGDLSQERGLITVNALITGGSPPPAIFEWTVQQPDGNFLTFNAGERGSLPVTLGNRVTPSRATLTVREPADIQREIRLRVATGPFENNAWSVSKSWMAEPTLGRRNNNNNNNNRRNNEPVVPADSA